MEHNENVGKSFMDEEVTQDKALSQDEEASQGEEISQGEEVTQDKEVSQDELDAVSGGAFWLGDTAPDGHEVGCFALYYDDWEQFDYEHSETYCKGTHGRKHEFGEPYTVEQGPMFFRVYSTFQKCKYCGHLISV